MSRSLFRFASQACLLVLLLLLPAEIARACSCGATPTVLESFDGSEVVVILRVLSVEKVVPKKAPDAKQSDEPAEREERYVADVRSTTMRVEKIYKGKVKVGDELVFGQGGGGDCIWTFDEESIGRQYLFYLDTPDKPGALWYAVACGRNTPLAGAGEDLPYLDNMRKWRGKTRVSGNYGGWQNPDLEAANRTIRIIGEKKTYETKTNDAGVFEVYNLPPGKYRLEPELEPGWKINTAWLRHSTRYPGNAQADETSTKSIDFVVEPKKHTSVDLVFQPDTAVEGTVVGPTGEPLPDVCPHLTAPDQKEDLEGGPVDCTDNIGRFRIDSVYPGAYLVVLNPAGKQTSTEPFGRLFYPGTPDREQAAVIRVGAGETVKGINIVVPNLAKQITVEGVLYTSDDKPVADQWVDFQADSKDGIDGDTEAKTDAQGRFSLKVLEGVSGNVSSELVGFVGLFENCPKFDEMVKESGKTFLSISTPPVAIQARQDIYNVVLRFPFPSCKRKHR